MTTAPNLSQEAHRRIIGMILEGALKPGDALQEAPLGEMLGMSRTPVREAIKRIESEGLAETSGRFIRVSRIGASEIEEIFFLRLALEPGCAQAAAKAPPPGLDAVERRIRDLMAQDTGADLADAQREADNSLHDLLALAGGNRTIQGALAALRHRTCVFDHTQVPDRFLKGCDEHLEIIAAVRSGDGALAADAMTRHLTHARDAILARLAEIQNQPEQP
ncbi:GntR family transcriptional regulator [Paracoccus aminophilus]|uniref:Transcriptional regulator, GntR family n=1 Tax=Paracoccus aminophilus JCM 7686 TaxID=1367847 RepID=S5YTK5_PARAH|nr:GntR family transcriptional regulator [Paracoccus aminophilus]AGT08541.1 transcriptional regulator, GntR family [Paracoccus aminophilus JCM 7686]